MRRPVWMCEWPNGQTSRLARSVHETEAAALAAAEAWVKAGKAHAVVYELEVEA